MVVAPEARILRDGAPGLEAALVAIWGDDYSAMIYADTAVEVEKRFPGPFPDPPQLRKWRLKSKAVADSLYEAGDWLLPFTCLAPAHWKAARTTNTPTRGLQTNHCRAMIERLNEEFRRRIKTQTVLTCAKTVPMLFWVLLASGEITMRKIDRWQTLDKPIEAMPLDLAA